MLADSERRFLRLRSPAARYRHRRGDPRLRKATTRVSDHPLRSTTDKVGPVPVSGTVFHDGKPRIVRSRASRPTPNPALDDLCDRRGQAGLYRAISPACLANRASISQRFALGRDEKGNRRSHWSRSMAPRPTGCSPGLESSRGCVRRRLCNFDCGAAAYRGNVSI